MEEIWPEINASVNKLLQWHFSTRQLLQEPRWCIVTNRCSVACKLFFHSGARYKLATTPLFMLLLYQTFISSHLRLSIGAVFSTNLHAYCFMLYLCVFNHGALGLLLNKWLHGWKKLKQERDNRNWKKKKNWKTARKKTPWAVQRSVKSMWRKACHSRFSM